MLKRQKTALNSGWLDHFPDVSKMVTLSSGSQLFPNPSNRPMLPFPPFQQSLSLFPLRHRLCQGPPEFGRVGAVDEVSHLVGDHVFEGDFGGLDEAPVDPQDIVLAAGAPGVFGIREGGGTRKGARWAHSP